MQRLPTKQVKPKKHQGRDKKQGPLIVELASLPSFYSSQVFEQVVKRLEEKGRAVRSIQELVYLVPDGIKDENQRHCWTARLLRILISQIGQDLTDYAWDLTLVEQGPASQLALAQLHLRNSSFSKKFLRQTIVDARAGLKKIQLVVLLDCSTLAPSEELGQLKTIFSRFRLAPVVCLKADDLDRAAKQTSKLLLSLLDRRQIP